MPGDDRLPVLSVLLDVPAPPVTGLHIRQMANLRLIRELGCESHALVFTTAARPKITAELNEICDVVVNAGPRREYSDLHTGYRLWLRCHMGLDAIFRRRSRFYPFSIPYDLAGAAKKIVEAASGIRAAAVVLPTVLLHIAPELRRQGALVIGDAVDVMSELTRKFLRYGRRSPIRLAGLLVNHWASVRQEQFFLSACSEIWATTEGEAKFFRRHSPAANVLVAGNTFDERAILPAPRPLCGPVGFIGTYSVVPNLDAAIFLADEVLPLLRRRQPDARIALAGAGMPCDIAERLGRTPGVEILGQVPDSVAFISSCSVLALPVRTRGGLPLKLVEALACAVPVVAVPELIEGVHLCPGEELLVADTPQAFADELDRILGDSDLACALGKKGRQRFEAEFSFGAAVRRAKLASLVASGGAHAQAVGCRLPEPDETFKT